MSAGKKERDRIKRRTKQQQLRKARQRSPLDGLRPGEGTLRMYMQKDWKPYRQASIFAVREVKGRRITVGFLVDQGVAGLKDAWMMTDVTTAEFNDILRQAGEITPIGPCDPDAARALIAGAIRFATQYGFRLPANLDKALKVIDGVGDWRQADVSEFVPEFAGSMRDLRARCIGESPESFLSRDDVTFIIDNAAPSLIDEEAEYADDADELDAVKEMVKAMRAMNDAMVASVERWCDETGQTPHPQLADAVNLKLMAAFDQLRQMPPPAEEEAFDPDAIPFPDPTPALERELMNIAEPERPALRAALEQIRQFNEANPEPFDMDGDGETAPWDRN
ncbi:MAG TPA: hypothetical protein VGN72_08715 [Tepidisphaeraceae bacterium]|jgi:hypothetical protein|nr:hypothetical protein [Tepidisphaeraceae bacterium]